MGATIPDTMTYEISIRETFSASHQLRLYDGSLEPLHGHDWTVIVTVAADQLDEIGVVMDFHVLERKLKKILAPFESKHLNEIEPFTSLNPSAENVASHIAGSLTLPEKVRLVLVEAWETPDERARVRF